MISDDPLKAMLIRHEGQVRLNGQHVAYDDKTGARLDIGDTLIGCLTIGIGHNLTDRGLSNDIAMHILVQDIERVRCELDQALPWWTKLDEVRQAVLISMGFNLGVLTPEGKAKLLTFVNTLGYMRTGHYDKAAENMLLSKWATQVGPRAVELSDMMRSGKWHADHATT